MSEAENVCAMAWDSFRLALGMKTRTFPPAEVLRWLHFRAALSPFGAAEKEDRDG